MELNTLKRLRAEKGMTLRELSRVSDIDQSTISQIENSRQKGRLDTLGKLARALDVPIDDLMSLADTTGPSRGRAGGAKRRELQNEKAVKFEPDLLAELNRRAAMPDTEFLTEAESEADTAAMLERVERELQLAS